MSESSPARLIQIATGHWASQILANAVEYKVFTHLDKAPLRAAELAKLASISERGAQALLDGALGLGLVTKNGDRYANSAEAAQFLVEGRPAFMGFAGIAGFDYLDWAHLREAVRTGTTPKDETSYEIKDNAFWERLVKAIAPLAAPVAEGTARHLGLSQRGPFHVLDVGGGSGIYSATWLKHNPAARATQLDWPNVNEIARRFVGGFGVGERFDTLDGSMFELDLGTDRYDYAIFAHMAHGLSEAQNQDFLGRFRKAIKPGGTLVLADFVLDDERRGHPMALLFYANMLHSTAEGRTYTRGEYERWLKAAGFERVETQAIEPTPVTVVYAS